MTSLKILGLCLLELPSLLLKFRRCCKAPCIHKWNCPWNSGLASQQSDFFSFLQSQARAWSLRLNAQYVHLLQAWKTSSTLLILFSWLISKLATMENYFLLLYVFKVPQKNFRFQNLCLWTLETQPQCKAEGLQKKC